MRNCLSGFLVPCLLAGSPLRGELPLDPKDGQPVLLGACTREQILAHRASFRPGPGKEGLPETWRSRWKAVAAPCTLVIAFGSWCGDSQRELPEVLALLSEPNPFVTVHFLGVGRDKVAQADWWPKGFEPPRLEKVPTLWVYTLEPGGGHSLAGAIVENPPLKGQSMAEAVLDLLERAAR